MSRITQPSVRIALLVRLNWWASPQVVLFPTDAKLMNRAREILV
jgi:hypothetical protein